MDGCGLSGVGVVGELAKEMARKNGRVNASRAARRFMEMCGDAERPGMPHSRA